MGVPNWQNRTLWTRDNLDVLRGMHSETVDLIYLDPPFNSSKIYAAPIGGEKAREEFKNTWTLDDLDVAWLGRVAHKAPALYRVIDAAGHTHSGGMQSYLTMMAVRLLEMRRILKQTGSLYLHCDPVASHYLKLLMDSIFGAKRGMNEIIWSYHRFSRQGKGFPSMHDTLFAYTMSAKSVFNPQHVEPRDTARLRRGYHTVVDRGIKKLLIYDADKVMAAGIDLDGYDEVVHTKARRPILGSSWTDIASINSQARERVGYRTQKPLGLLRRIILASSNPDDMILDPFCGCATACVAAEELGRQWVGIDISPKAKELIRKRFAQNLDLFKVALESTVYRNDVPERCDLSAEESQEEIEFSLPVPQRRYNSAANKEHLFGKQRGICPGCRRFFEYRHLEVDHIHPRAKGGGDELENLQLLCGSCNREKGMLSMAEFDQRRIDALEKEIARIQSGKRTP